MKEIKVAFLMSTGFVILAISLLGCNTEDVLISNPKTKISFKVSKTSPTHENATPDSFESKVKGIIAKHTSSRGYKYANNYSLHRSTSYGLLLENGRELQFVLDISITEQDTDLVVLNEDRSWQYISKAAERNQLLSAFTYIHLSFDHCWYWMNCENDCRQVTIESIHEARVTGLIQNYVTIKFGGDIANGYDPEGAHLGYYTLEDGYFADVLLN